MNLVVEGFAHPDGSPQPSESFDDETLKQVFHDFAASAGFSRYLARVHGADAGGAGLRLSDSVAQFCGASTLPAFRRRGVQSALFRSRLADARAAGCDVGVVTTQPGWKQPQRAAPGVRAFVSAGGIDQEPDGLSGCVPEDGTWRRATRLRTFVADTGACTSSGSRAARPTCASRSSGWRTRPRAGGGRIRPQPALECAARQAPRGGEAPPISRQPFPFRRSPARGRSVASARAPRTPRPRPPLPRTPDETSRAHPALRPARVRAAIRPPRLRDR